MFEVYFVDYYFIFYFFIVVYINKIEEVIIDKDYDVFLVIGEEKNWKVNFDGIMEFFF